MLSFNKFNFYFCSLDKSPRQIKSTAIWFFFSFFPIILNYYLVSETVEAIKQIILCFRFGSALCFKARDPICSAYII